MTERGQIILKLEEKLENQMAQEVRTLEEIEFEKNRFIKEFHFKTQEYDQRIESLLAEIGNLHEEIYQIELNKDKEV